MEEIKKSFYTIKEAAEVKGIHEEEIIHGIREGRIKTKQVGMRMMIPENALDDFKMPLSTEKIERYLERLHSDLVNMLQTAPRYGAAGITVTFHDAKIVKVNNLYEKTRLGE